MKTAILLVLSFIAAASSALAGSSATQTIQIGVEPIRVIKAVGGTGNGTTSSDTVEVTVSPEAVSTGDTIVWTANADSKLVLQGRVPEDLEVRTIRLQGKSLPTAWVKASSGMTIMSGIDREIGSCRLELRSSERVTALLTVSIVPQ